MPTQHQDPWSGIVDPGCNDIKIRRVCWDILNQMILNEFGNDYYNFTQKMCQLLSFMTTLNRDHGIYGLWIDINMFKNNDYINSNTEGISIKLLISLSSFMSNTTNECTFSHYVTPKTLSNINKKIYYLIQIFEDPNYNIGPLLTLRIDKDGEYGELVWIRKGIKLNGNNILNIFEKLSDYFNIKYGIYLNDDSNILLPKLSIQNYIKNNVKLTKSKKGLLRIIHLLSYYNKNNINIGKTWYGKHSNFKPINIKDWPSSNDNKPTKSQNNIKKYNDKIQYLRNFKLNDIIKYCLVDDDINRFNEILQYYNKYTFDIDCINYDRNNQTTYDMDKPNYKLSKDNLYRKEYYNNNIESKYYDIKLKKFNYNTKLSLKTVHDLFRRIHCNAFYGETKWKKNIGKRHLRIIYDLIICNNMSKKKYEYFVKTKKGQEYQDSLSFLETFTIYCKGKHTKDHKIGLIDAKKISLKTIKNWRKNIDKLVDQYYKNRQKSRNDYNKLSRLYAFKCVNNNSDSDSIYEEFEEEQQVTITIKKKRVVKRKRRRRNSMNNNNNNQSGSESESDNDNVIPRKKRRRY